MADNKNNGGNNTPRPEQKPYFEHGDYHERSHPDGRTTTTSQKPAPGHKK